MQNPSRQIPEAARRLCDGLGHGEALRRYAADAAERLAFEVESTMKRGFQPFPARKEVLEP